MVRAATVLTAVLENMYFMTRRSLRVQLAAIRSIVSVAGISEATYNKLPKDPRTSFRRLQLDPIVREFVGCPSCHCLYPYNPGDSPQNPTDPFLTHCTYARTPRSNICQSPLWQYRNLPDGRPHPTPIRKYIHQDIKSWLGRLVSRKGVEEVLDHPTLPVAFNSPDIDDIWRSAAFRDLKGPDGMPFLPAPLGEGRLIFSLSVDSFNPFHNKTAKQSVSSTGIWLVLLNFPQHLRYLKENMCAVGVIPGPDKPSKEDIYPYLELLVAELLELWQKGVFFSKTYREALGRFFRGMLIPVVCDMLAVRQIIGFSSSTSHNFCTFCDLDHDDLEVCDKREWPAKDAEVVRKFARLWRDAPDRKVQDAIFDASGIRWSPLHDLPYWDPIRYAVVDSMHALDLNLLQNHCRDLFQIDLDHDGSEGVSRQIAQPDPRELTTRALKNSMRRAVGLIRQNNINTLLEALLKEPRRVLYAICCTNNIIGGKRTIVVGTKWVLANDIVAWVCLGMFCKKFYA